jgi:hypothetical protein
MKSLRNRVLEVTCSNGVTGYTYECPDGHWEIRFCERVVRGFRRREWPESVCGTFNTAKEAVLAIARQYGTTICSPSWRTGLR